uniref:Uncharacterized protein n=1 Tax=Cucumis melo TaxID=3656 RepID=A0A9I9DNY0_CUCME
MLNSLRHSQQPLTRLWCLISQLSAPNHLYRLEYQPVPLCVGNVKPLHDEYFYNSTTVCFPTKLFSFFSLFHYKICEHEQRCPSRSMLKSHFYLLKKRKKKKSRPISRLHGNPRS